MAYQSFAAGYLVRNERVLLVHHRKFNKWTPPGGHIEENETPDNAVIREWKEELGLEVSIKAALESAYKGDNYTKPIPLPFHIDLEVEGFDVPHIGYFFYIDTRNDISGYKIQEAELLDASWFGKEDLKVIETFDQVRALAAFAIEHYPK